VAQIAASIREFGFTNPVLIDGQDGIIAGHGRVLGARKLGMSDVPCIRLAHLSEAQKRAYVIADNKLALNAGWDEKMLALELQDLQGMDFDLSLTGFLGNEIDELLAELEAMPEGATEADEVPAVQAEAISMPGDVWMLGKHRLMCGDSTSAADVARLMDGKKAALIHADPPYGMGKEGDGVANDNLYAGKLDEFQMQWWKAFRPSVEDNSGIYIWGNAADLWRLWWRGGLEASERMTMRNEITWDKKTAGAGGISHMGADGLRQYPCATERCLFFMLGEQGFNTNADNYWEGYENIRSALAADVEKMGWGPKDIERICGVGMYSHWFSKSQWTFIPEQHYKKLQSAAREHDAFKREHDAFKREHDDIKREHDDIKREHDDIKREFYATRAYFDNTHDAMTDVWEFPRVTGEDRHGHATPKPVAMMERVMKSSLPPGGLCVEPFGGSGSTLIGAETTGRVCYTMELQGKYVDVAVRRWQQYTGKQAVHADTGKTFDETAAVNTEE
jgi:DNA modification methylase